MEEYNMVVKVNYGDTLRRFTAYVNEGLGVMDLNMNVLRAKSLNFFNLSLETDLTFTYVDEDGDVVTLGDDNDLRDAVIGQHLNPLRITVLSKASKAEASDPKSQSESSASTQATPLRIEPPFPIKAGVENALKSVPEPFRNALLKLYSDLISKAASSAPAITELVEYYSKLGALIPNQDGATSSTPMDLNVSAGFEASIDPVDIPKQKPNSSSVEQVSGDDQKGYDDGNSTRGLRTSAPGATPVDLNLNPPREDTPLSGNAAAAVSSVTPNVNDLMGLNPYPSQASGFAKQSVPKYDATYVLSGENIIQSPPSGAKWKFPGGVAEPFASNIAHDGLHPTGCPFKKSSSHYDGILRTFHRGIGCDGCGMIPIMGPRFKSKVKDDYDLCNFCFSEMGNEADYTRIDRPSYQSPRMFYPHPRFHGPSSHAIRGCGMKPSRPKLESRFIQDVTILDGTLIVANTPFSKIWRMRNNGTLAWPHGTQLVWIGGDRLGDRVSVELEIPANGCAVNAELDISVDFIAPSYSGRYISYWRMASPSGQKFGQRVWVLIQVDTGLSSLSDSFRTGLNLNLPPESNGQKGKGKIVDINVKPVDCNPFIPDASHPKQATAELVKPLVDEPRIRREGFDFQVDNGSMAGGGNGVPPASEVSVPVLYPIIDLSEPAPVVEMQAPPPVVTNRDTVEQALLKELEEMGFRQTDLNKAENFVENKALLDYSKLSENGEVIKPRSLAVSEFHFLLLIGDKVKVLNRISQQIIEELQFDHAPESISRGIIGLCSDATAVLFYAYDQNSIFQVSVQDEGRDMWQVYLDMKEYAAALAHCRDPVQRDQVYLVQAEAAFSAKDFFRAASFYAKMNFILSFEEITLKFISLGEQDALRTFLLRKLDNLAKDDKCQITMISTWATELYLDKINRLLLEDDKESIGGIASEICSSEYQSIIKEFRAFLSDCKDVLDEATTMRLLESYGRVEELVYFASLKEQYEIVIHHYIQQGETKKALEVLQKPNVPIDLQYKFAPDLIMLDAYETVESWMTTSNLNPRRLIPAMMRYSSEPHAKNETHEVIKYLEFCVHRLLNEDPGVHNLLLSLYAKQEDDSALLRFLQCKFGKGQTNGPEFFYDPKYALRLCLKEKRMRACVHIYSMMYMHEEAVALALQVDPELAMAEADKVEEDEDLRKKLWLMVAKHVIEQEKGAKRENIRKAIAFLKETDGLLKIEDILPFFPDFALIDDFKEAICSSLEDYNKQIEQLKQEMNDATRGADNIRNDISALSQRYAVIDRDEDCGVCRRMILSAGGARRMARGYTSVGPMAPFYVFPCGHAFHSECLIAHVTRCTNRTQAEYILDLQKQLSLLGTRATRDSTAVTEDDSVTSMTHVDKIRSLLDDAIASECPFCGDLMIREISLPFVLPEEAQHAASWEIKKQLGNQRSLPMAI